jgi:hypothetical protein
LTAAQGSDNASQVYVTCDHHYNPSKNNQIIPNCFM